MWNQCLDCDYNFLFYFVMPTSIQRQIFLFCLSVWLGLLRIFETIHKQYENVVYEKKYILKSYGIITKNKVTWEFVCIIWPYVFMQLECYAWATFKWWSWWSCWSGAITRRKVFSSLICSDSIQVSLQNVVRLINIMQYRTGNLLNNNRWKEQKNEKKNTSMEWLVCVQMPYRNSKFEIQIIICFVICVCEYTWELKVCSECLQIVCTQHTQVIHSENAQ